MSFPPTVAPREGPADRRFVMAKAFAITTTETSIRLDDKRRAEFSCTVTNTSRRRLRARVKIDALESAKEEWFSVATPDDSHGATRGGTLELDFPADATYQLTVRIEVPPDAVIGKYACRVNAHAEDNPDEDFAEGPVVAFELKKAEEKKKKAFPWWIIPVIVGVLVIAGVVIYLVLPKKVEVPAVTGIPVADARVRLEDVGLVAAEAEEPTAAVAQGQVIRQEPEPGTEVKRGSEVALVVASAPPIKPDLTVTFVQAPGSAEPGENIGQGIRLRVRNAGTAVAPQGYVVEVLLSTDQNLPPGFAQESAQFREDMLLAGSRITIVDELQAGSEKIFQVQGLATIPDDTPNGTYLLGARVDPNGQVDEFDETNNVDLRQLTVARPKPDLSVSFVLAPTTAEPGENLGQRMRLSVRNQGRGVATAGFVVEILLSTDRNLPPGFAQESGQFREDMLLAGSRIPIVEDLRPGALKQFQVQGLATIPGNTPNGTYLLAARVDPNNQVDESNEGNNADFRQITVERLCIVPNVRTRQQGAAIQLIRNAGLNPVVRRRPGFPPLNIVIIQAPDPNSKVKCGTDVTITVR